MSGDVIERPGSADPYGREAPPVDGRQWRRDPQIDAGPGGARPASPPSHVPSGLPPAVRYTLGAESGCAERPSVGESRMVSRPECP
jgi:hypothetical protein